MHKLRTCILAQMENVRILLLHIASILLPNLIEIGQVNLPKLDAMQIDIIEPRFAHYS